MAGPSVLGGPGGRGSEGLHQEQGEIRKGRLPILFVILFKSTDEVGDPGEEWGRAAELHRSHDRL